MAAPWFCREHDYTKGRGCGSLMHWTAGGWRCPYHNPQEEPMTDDDATKAASPEREPDDADTPAPEPTADVADEQPATIKEA